MNRVPWLAGMMSCALGCGGLAPLVDPSPPAWTRATASPESVLLRRRHEVGERYTSCSTGDLRAAAPEMPEGRGMTFAGIVTTEIREAPPHGPFGVLYEFDAAFGLDQATGAGFTTVDDQVHYIDERNRPMGSPSTPSPPPNEPLETFNLPLAPEGVAELPELPEAELHPGDTLRETRTEVHHTAGEPPATQRLDIVWTYVGVVEVEGARFAYLTSDITYRWDFAATREDGAHAEGTSHGRVSGELRIDLRDGYTARGRWVFRGEGSTTTGSSPAESTSAHLTAEGSIDLVHVREGLEDPICDMARRRVADRTTP